jgi:hypothetical protein
LDFVNEIKDSFVITIKVASDLSSARRRRSKQRSRDGKKT